MSPEPDTARQSQAPLVGAALPANRYQTGFNVAMPKLTQPIVLSDRIRTLIAELRPRAPEWADRLSRVQSERAFLEVIGELFNLAHTLKPPRNRSAHAPPLPVRIGAFMSANLHKGLTLKLLSQHLGYSEKYCSDLFQATMGESFSDHLKRRRIETASGLLATSEKGVSEIATALGFSDQFAFSHFFKRATGQSPMQFRSHHHRRSRKPSSLLSKGRS